MSLHHWLVLLNLLCNFLVWKFAQKNVSYNHPLFFFLSKESKDRVAFCGLFYSLVFISFCYRLLQRRFFLSMLKWCFFTALLIFTKKILSIQTVTDWLRGPFQVSCSMQQIRDGQFTQRTQQGVGNEWKVMSVIVSEYDDIIPKSTVSPPTHSLMASVRVSNRLCSVVSMFAHAYKHASHACTPACTLRSPKGDTG